MKKSIEVIKNKIKDSLNIQRVIPWDQFFRQEASPYRIYRVEPGRSVRNNQSYLLAKVVATFYRPDKDLFDLFKNKTVLTVRSPYRFNFRIIMTSKEIGFYILVPDDKAYEVLRRIEGIYDTNITVKEIMDLPKLNPNKVFCTELKYRNHDIFSIATDKDNNYPLPSLLSTARTLEGNDLAIFDAMLEPYNREKWGKECTSAYNLLDQGYIPQSGPAGIILREIHQGINKLRYGVADLFAVTREQKARLKQLMREEARNSDVARIKSSRTNATRRKADDDIVKSWLRIAVQSDDITRARTAAYSIANSFKDISSDDNELVRRDIPSKWNAKYIEAVEDRKPLMVVSTYNKMSVEEAGKLTQLPGDQLIKEFPQIISQNLKEVTLPDELTQDDIKHVRIGTVTERGKQKLACIPLEAYGDIQLKSVYDALCTSSFAQGQQGSGKSDGYGSVWAYDMVTNGFTAICIDTADGQVLRNIINSLPADFPDDHIHAISVDNKAYPIPLGWEDIYGRTFTGDGDEELQALEISEKITARFISFINGLSVTGEFTDRMAQYVISCMRAITKKPGWAFLDLELCLTSPAYRQELIDSGELNDMPEVIHDLMTLQEKAAEGKAGQITEFILNRLRALSSTQFMANMFYQPPKLKEDGSPVLDFRKLMDNPGGGKYGHLIAIQASYDAWQDNQATILGFFIDKINFNAFSRIDQEQADRKPVLVWIDEPHKVIKSIEGKLAGTAVEFRKYRVKNLFTGHSIDQMGAAANALLDGGAQITSYKTERLSELARFAHSFQPYDNVKELYESLPKKWKAINAVRLPSGNTCPAFLADMTPPPKIVRDRTYIWNECAKRYGRPWKEVREVIQEKRSHYMELDANWLEDLEAKKEAEKEAKKEAAAAAKKAAMEAKKEAAAAEAAKTTEPPTEEPKKKTTVKKTTKKAASK